MTHKQGQDAIVSAGNDVPIVVQRFGGPDIPAAPGTWRPTVEIVGGPAVNSADPGQTYTKTSLLAGHVPEVGNQLVGHVPEVGSQLTGHESKVVSLLCSS